MKKYYIFNEQALQKHPLITKLIKLKHIARALNRQDLTSIPAAFNYIIQNVENNVEVSHYIYSEDEIRSKPSKKNVKLWHFPVESKNSPFVVVCPGGAYMECVTIHEGYPIAQKINELGYSAFVLKYRVGDDSKNFCQMDDLANTIRYILKNANSFNVDPSDYAVLGFSAGGHLTGSYGTKHLGYRKYNIPPPSALILCYAALSMELLQHKKMKKTLLGECPSQEIIDTFSVEKNVDSKFPHTFIWQCKADKDVVVDQTLRMKNSLDAESVENETLLFEGGKHGIGLGIGTNAESWLEKAIKFWQKK